MLFGQDQHNGYVGTMIINKQDGLLFRRSTRHASRTVLHKGELADDVVLLAWSREAAHFTIKAYVEVASSLSLILNFPRLSMIIGSAVSEDDQQPLSVDDGLIECVDHFSYFG